MIDAMKKLSFFLAGLILCLAVPQANADTLVTDTTFQIVESVPEATIYGQPGVPRTQRVWLDMINGAKKSIDIAAFYITNKPGKALAPVMDAIVAQARAGVKVRILLGSIFLRDSRSSIAPLKNIPNIQIRIFPVDSLTGGVLHAKYFIVDDSRVFVGSQNWDWRAMNEIHEIGVRVDNRRFAHTFTAVFNFDWYIAGHPSLPKAERAAVWPPDFAPVTATNPVILQNGNNSVVAFPAFSPPSLIPRWVNGEQQSLVRLIHSAQHTLRIQVLTFSALIHYGPKGYWPELDNALRDAAARGVKVEIIVANWALREPMQAYLKSLTVLPNITVKFSTVPPSPKGFIPYARVEHCKYAVADDSRAYIGTGNWQWSYFNNTVDASVFFSGKNAVAPLIHIFDRDWNGPYVTTLQPGVKYQQPRNH